MTSLEYELERTATLERTPTFVNLAHVQSAGTRRTRRVSSLDEGESGMARARSTSVQHLPNDEIDPEVTLSLTRTASRISGHREAYLDEQRGRQLLTVKPDAAKARTFEIIKEMPTPLASPPSSPTRRSRTASITSNGRDNIETLTEAAQAYPPVSNGTLASPRGAAILICACTAQLLDNIFLTGVNISIPAIQKEFNVPSTDLQWLLSAYTLTFGGFLLLSGVLADRYGRKYIFCAGMAMLSVWTLANGFASSFIQMAVFRALQGIGAAMTIPSSVGVIDAYFVSKDRARALSMFGAAGAVGFCIGLVLGGFLTASIGWRYLFYLSVILSGLVVVAGVFALPKDVKENDAKKPKLDFAGVGLSTSGLILLSFVLSSGGEYGWSKAFIIVLLILSVALLVAFTFVEREVSNPVMPMSLWKLHNFAAIWVAGFVMYGNYQTIVYYTVLIASDVEHLTAGQTAVRYLPMGAFGFSIAMSMGNIIDRVNVKWLLCLGMLLCTVAPISATTMGPEDVNFWKHIFPTTLLGVGGVAIGYCTITVVLLSSVPASVKSLCAGMINTAYQIGAGVALATSTAVIQAVDVKHGRGVREQYTTGLYCSLGFGGLALLTSIVGIRGVGRVKRDDGIPIH